MQTPTLRAADYLVDIVGESNYQDALEAAAGGRTQDGPLVPLVTAVLVREPTNPHDRNAVRVDVGGSAVGYIPRDQATAFHPCLQFLAAAGRPATCRAWLTGGWDRGVLDRGHFGLRLDLHPNLECWGDEAPLLPFGRGRISIVGEESSQNLLNGLLGDAQRIELLATLTAAPTALDIVVEGTRVGSLTNKMTARYRPWVEAAHAAGFAATCEARVVRGPKKTEAFLKLAHPW